MSGVLTITLNSANKLLHWLMTSRKSYVGLMKLHKPVPKGRLEEVFFEFESEIYQTPPFRAAVKRQTRRRKVYRLQILESESEYVLFRADVDAGTYVRKLCFDIGEALGVGASMIELRRTSSGAFDERSCVTLNRLAYLLKVEKNEEEASRFFIPVEVALPEFPVLVVRESAVKNLYNGAPLMAPGVVCVSNDVKAEGQALVYSESGELIEVALSKRGKEEILQAHSGVVAVPIRVLDPRVTTEH